MLTIDEILRNIDTVTARIDAAADGRAVQMVLATKTQPKELLQSLAAKGSFIFGENRVQEFCDKFFTQDGLRWHFIGQLQTNKVKYVIGKVDLIHSLDRQELAAELQRQADKLNITVDVLVELNIGGEESKGGVSPDCLTDFLESLKAFPRLRVKGLMCVYPNLPYEELAPYCAKMSELFDVAQRHNGGNVDVSILSTGMSHDYVQAIENGANTVRIGSAVFGPRG